MDDDHAWVWYCDSSPVSDWEIWANQVEFLLGHDLDGNQKTDGYSLDMAYELWEAGLDGGQAAAVIRVIKYYTVQNA